jgi:cobyrinic acid a,c-diamide synthase
LADALIIAAPHSGSGKTVVTLGLLRALRNSGVRVSSAKAGPDYIDPKFHEAATGRPCVNLDPWAMAPGEIAAHMAAQSDAALIVIEGVMGLFDGPDGARGSTADLAADLGLPVALVIDCAHQAQSIAALAQGFIGHRADVRIAGVILNRVASERHEALLRTTLRDHGIPVLGAVQRAPSLALPSRHLGLVQAAEHAALEVFIEGAARCMSRALLDSAAAAARPVEGAMDEWRSWRPLGQRMAIARDDAFSFLYPHVLEGWRKAGAELSFFSPLADEAPDGDAVFLPGGYPELHAGKLASAERFKAGLRKAATVYGECGGYMVLGEYLIDAEGARHEMAGLLPLGTSFAKRKLHLGYRQLESRAETLPAKSRGHEFHYSTIDWQGEAEPLFHAEDAAGRDLGPMGQRIGNAMGSYAHLIAEAR